MTSESKNGAYDTQDYFDGYQFNILDFFSLLLSNWLIVFVVGAAVGLIYFVVSHKAPSILVETTLQLPTKSKDLVLNRTRYNGYIYNGYELVFKSDDSDKAYFKQAFKSKGFETLIAKDNEMGVYNAINAQLVPSGLRLSASMPQDVKGLKTSFEKIVNQFLEFAPKRIDNPYTIVVEKLRLALADCKFQKHIIDTAFTFKEPPLAIYYDQLNAKKQLLGGLKKSWQVAITEARSLTKIGNDALALQKKPSSKSKANIDPALVAMSQEDNTFSLLLSQLNLLTTQINTLTDQINHLEEEIIKRNYNIDRDRINYKQEARTALSLLEEQKTKMQVYLEQVDHIYDMPLIVLSQDKQSFSQRVLTSTIVGFLPVLPLHL